VAAARWLESLRQLTSRSPARRASVRRGRLPGNSVEGTLVTSLRLRQPLAGALHGVLLVVRVEIGETDRPPLDVHVVPVVCRAAGAALRRRPATEVVGALLAGGGALIEGRVALSLGDRVEEVLAMARRTRETGARRQEGIREAQATAAARALLQPGLFGHTHPRATRPPEADGATNDERDLALHFRSDVALAAVFHAR
jgi:hypothetical protein